MSETQKRDGVHVCMRVNNTFTYDQRVRREAEALVEAGYKVTVVADYKPGQDLALEETLNGVLVKRIAKSSRIPYWSIVRPLRDERADIYHAHDIDSLFPALAASKLAGKDAKVVYDSHELWSGHAADKIHKRRRQLVKYEGQMLRRTSALITASPAYTEAILDTYGYDGPTVTLLNVPRVFSDDELAEEWRQRDADERVRIAYVSVFQQGRGAIPLIESLAHLPEEYTLQLIGPARPDYEQKMRAAAEPFGDRVEFVGMVPGPEVIPRMARAHISAVPIEPHSKSYQLTAPNKLFDSMMAGTPILASDMKVIGSVVREERVGEVADIADPRDIARAAREAHANAEEYRRNCRTAALQRYNWEAEKRKLVELYEGLSAR